MTEPAAYAYEKLGMILENASDYRGAVNAWETAFDFCQAHGVSGTAQLCLGCLAFVFRKTGEWDRAVGVCRDVLAAGEGPRSARCAAVGQLGFIHTLRGEPRRGRPLLINSLAQAYQAEFIIMKIDSVWGLARADQLEEAYDGAEARCLQLLDLARESEDGHYPVPALRWAATWFASRGAAAETGACAECLARLASSTGSAEALAALAHVLGEIAFLDGDPDRASQQFLQALEHLRELELPLDRAETQMRAGVALAGVGEREAGIERLTDCYRAARKLGARPLAAQAAQELATLGERVERRLGRRAARALESNGLTRRELEIVRLVAVGRTNREIARELFLSPRTVEMHVSHALTKLRCRSRVEVAARAAEAGLLI